MSDLDIYVRILTELKGLAKNQLQRVSTSTPVGLKQLEIHQLKKMFEDLKD